MNQSHTFRSLGAAADRKSAKPTTVVYLINVDWFFVSHFAHLARRAIANGHAAILASAMGPSSAKLEGSGINLFELPYQRNGVRPKGLTASIHAVERLLSRIPEPVLHGFGLFGVLVGTLATRRAKSIRRVYTITGRGYAAADRSPMMLPVVWGGWVFNRCLADGADTRWMVENKADIARSGLSRACREGRVRVVGGAGVDPDVFALSPMPPRPPLRVGFVARLVWSKGLDIAVRAVALARSRGCDVTLTVAGAPDSSNPRTFREDQLAAFAATPGVRFVGKIDDVPGFWREHHLMLLPSRGGEGLPKSLLEAASCGRPLLASQVPGCEDLALATKGWIVPVEDVEATAGAIIEIAARDDIEQRGRLARSIVERQYSEASLWQTAQRLYFG